VFAGWSVHRASRAATADPVSAKVAKAAGAAACWTTEHRAVAQCLSVRLSVCLVGGLYPDG